MYRSYQGKETYIVILNLENKCNIITLNNLFGNLPEEVRVVVSSPNAIHLKGWVVNITGRPHFDLSYKNKLPIVSLI